MWISCLVWFSWREATIFFFMWTKGFDKSRMIFQYVSLHEFLLMKKQIEEELSHFPSLYISNKGIFE